MKKANESFIPHTNELPPPPKKASGAAVAVECNKGKLTVYCEFFNKETGIREQKYYDVESAGSAKEFIGNFIDSFMECP